MLQIFWGIERRLRLHVVAQEVIYEEGVVDEVAFEEAAGFHGEAVCPF